MTPATPATPAKRRDRPWLRQLALLVALAATGAMSYFGAAYRAAARLERRSAEVDRAYERIAALGDAAGAEMARSLPEDLPTLADACRGKLAGGTASSILGYVPPAPREVEASMDALLAFHPRPYDLSHTRVLPVAIVAGSIDAEQAFLGIEPVAKQSEHRPTGTDAMWALIHDDPSPLGWGGYVAVESRRGPDVLGAKHLAVSLIRGAAPPTLIGERAYRGGVAILQVRVLELPSGKPECEGKQVVEMPAEVSGAALPGADPATTKADPTDLATAYDRAIAFGALHALCDVGGPELCAETARTVRDPAAPIRAEPPPSAPSPTASAPGSR